MGNMISILVLYGLGVISFLVGFYFFSVGSTTIIANLSFLCGVVVGMFFISVGNRLNKY